MAVRIRTKVTGVNVENGVVILQTNNGDISYASSPLSLSNSKADIADIFGETCDIIIQRAETTKDPCG